MSIQFNTVGPLSNKRFLATSTDVNKKTIQYILCTINSSTGSQLGIFTYYGDIGGVLEPKTILLPKLPYRLMMGPDIPTCNGWTKEINDKWLGGAGNNLQVEKDFINFYNPGMWVEGTNFKCNLDGIFDPPTKISFAEMNWSRFGLEKITKTDTGFGTNLMLQYFGLPNETRKTGFKNTINTTRFKVHDVYASMIVVNSDTNYDYIYLGVCSRVDIRPSFLTSSNLSNPSDEAMLSNNNFDSFFIYSIPTIVKLVIQRSDIATSFRDTTLDVIPKLNNTTHTRIHSWTYPGSTDCLRKVDSSRKYKTTINGGIYTDPSTSLWNFNLIPGYHVSHPTITTNTRAFNPYGFGAMLDIDYIDNNNIVSSSIVGYFNEGNQYRVSHQINKFDFTTPTGFFYSNAGTYFKQEYRNKFVKNNIICKESGNMFVSALGLYPDNNISFPVNQEIVLNFTPNNLDINNNKSFNITSGLEYPDLVEKDKTLYFGGRFPKSTSLISESGILINIKSVPDLIAPGNFTGTYDELISRINNQAYCNILPGVPKQLSHSSITSITSKKNVKFFWDIVGRNYTVTRKMIDVYGLDRSFDVTVDESTVPILLYYGFQDNHLYHCFQNAYNRCSTYYYPWANISVDSNNFYSQDDVSGTLPSYTGYSVFTLNSSFPSRSESYYTHPAPYIEQQRNTPIAGSSSSTSIGGASNVTYNPFQINQNYLVTFNPNQRLFGYDNQGDGIPITIHFISCTGLFSSDLIKTSNIREGGFPLTNYQTGVIIYNYYTNLEKFSRYEVPAGTRAYGYEAIGKEIEIVLSYEGHNLLYGGSVQRLQPHYYYYDKLGNFRFYVTPQLFLTSENTGGQNFNDPSFKLLNCFLEVKFFDNNGNNWHTHRTSNRTSNINIDPPNGLGNIIPIGLGARPKTASDINFQLTRDGDINSETYTTITNINRHIFSMFSKTENVTVESLNPTEISKNYITPSINLKCGDCVYYTFEPKLGGVKPTGNYMPVYTPIVSYCGGHRYNIDITTLGLYVDEGGPSENLIDLIRDTDPSYIYLNLSLTNTPISISADFLNEEWITAVTDPRQSMNPEDIYPFIASGFIFASELTHSNALDMQLIRHLNLYRSNDNARTYPNIEINLSQLSQYLSISNSGIYWDYLYWSPSYLPSELIAANLTIGNDPLISVRVPGKYRVYAGVVDQFEQVSLWCITNKAGNFRILGGN